MLPFHIETDYSAHKFLGLTREILRSESSLNSLVSHPLPREFYSGGGMQALRNKFQLDTDNQPRPDTTASIYSADARGEGGDYFDYVPASPTVRAPSLPAITPKFGMTPAASTQHLPRSPEGINSQPSSPALVHISPPKAAPFSPDTAIRQSSSFVRRVSGLRKQVAAGDLAMTRTNTNQDNGGSYYRHAIQTPALPRMETWRGRSADVHAHGGIHLDETPIGEEDMYELKAEVVGCIARSIGLQSAETSWDTFGRGSVASASVLSTPNSPMFPPHLAGRSSRQPFGNVLDMMNASTQQDNMLSGMLREAVLSGRADEDASSVSASMHESVMGGGDGMRGVFRDLEEHLEILYFKKGSVLVKEGERSPGLHYVIDGFLDVSGTAVCVLTNRSLFQSASRD